MTYTAEQVATAFRYWADNAAMMGVVASTLSRADTNTVNAREDIVAKMAACDKIVGLVYTSATVINESTPR